ncbi:hypothetical protein QJS66_06660 [Kocuria rhizophila]|nr:hypothetical protein QJS66_06660 [Kocuria rhizophila]
MTILADAAPEHRTAPAPRSSRRRRAAVAIAAAPPAPPGASSAHPPWWSPWPREAQPFLDLATAGCSIPQQVGGARLHALELEGRPMFLVRTGIGLVIRPRRWRPPSSGSSRARPTSPRGALRRAARGVNVGRPRRRSTIPLRGRGRNRLGTPRGRCPACPSLDAARTAALRGGAPGGGGGGQLWRRRRASPGGSFVAGRSVRANPGAVPRP